MKPFRVTGLFSPRPRVVVGLDLGSLQDHSAAVVMRKVGPPEGSPPGEKPELHVPYIRRWPLGTNYVAVVRDVVTMFKYPALAGHDLIVDATGCGLPVLQFLREERPDARVVGVLITGGAAQTFTGGLWHVAKVNLVSVAKVALQKRRVKFAGKMPETALITRELENYRMKLSLQAHEIYAAKDSEHDDLVMALCLAAWGQDNADRWTARMELLDPEAAGIETAPPEPLPGGAMWEGGPSFEQFSAELAKLAEQPPQISTGTDPDWWGVPPRHTTCFPEGFGM
jgi:hypothetical protein